MEEVAIKKDKPIRAYIFTSQASLIKPSHTNLRCFSTLQTGIDKFKSLSPRYSGKQVVFIDYSVQPSKIIHILNQ